jgi:hydrogenase nickel incorporation protein HypA/HybF
MEISSLTARIVENVLEIAKAQPACEITKVRLRLGDLIFIEAEQLRFCYRSMVRKTPLENSVLKIERVPPTVQCSHCHYVGDPKYWQHPFMSVAVPTLECPHCGKAAQATRGLECQIRSVQLFNPAAAKAA